jgi:hypothetical protein
VVDGTDAYIWFDTPQVFVPRVRSSRGQGSNALAAITVQPSTSCTSALDGDATTAGPPPSLSSPSSGGLASFFLAHRLDVDAAASSSSKSSSLNAGLHGGSEAPRGFFFLCPRRACTCFSWRGCWPAARRTSPPARHRSPHHRACRAAWRHCLLAVPPAQPACACRHRHYCRPRPWRF